ncbi:MAG: methionine gamma-lyase family protein [Clostridia bacterium]|nr:methionine gamma-lyase family protein [Clostridia bacterium]
MDNSFFEISPEILALGEKAMEMVKPYFKEIDEITEYNQLKMLKAFQNAKVSESCFTASTGYGYGDRGREVLDRIFAEVLDTEDALVRHHFASGTHTLTVALFGVLRPGDTMVSVTGLPYDTLQGVIGIGGESSGSLKEFGINYEQLDLLEDGRVDFEGMKRVIKPDTKMVYIQRSRGYSLRPTLTAKEIGAISELAHRLAPDCIVMLDNCYGEFVEKTAPGGLVDLMAGSLIKNPGGGIAPTGGYIAGKKELVEACSYRLTTPGTGKEIGCTLGQNRELFMGAFNAPHVTGEAVKTAVFASALFELMGYEVTPRYYETRGDIIQAILLGNEEKLIAFCRGIQAASPVDSFVTPEPWDMPGYDSKVIMAAGAFTLGASIELSADAPLREPYAVWMQGGLNFHTGKTAVLLAAGGVPPLS